MIELINGIIIIKEYTKVLLIKKASVSHIETISNKVIRIITQNGPVDVFFNKIDTDMTYSEYVSYLKANVLANSTFTKVLSDESYTISAGFISGALNNIAYRKKLSGKTKHLFDELCKEYPDYNFYFMMGQDVADNFDNFYESEFSKGKRKVYCV